MNPLTEAVARAICEEEWNGTQHWDHKPEVFKKCYRETATAAIAAVLDAMAEPTHAMERAALESVAVDDEGAFPSMLDMLDCSGENKSRTIIRAALKAAVAAFREDALQDVEGRK